MIFILEGGGGLYGEYEENQTTLHTAPEAILTSLFRGGPIKGLYLRPILLSENLYCIAETLSA